jgi:ABC-type transport system substrate-binding protein
MAKRKIWIILGITIILAMILGSCATPTAAPVVEVIRETVVAVETVEVPVVETIVQTVEVPAEPESPEPQGTLVVAVSTYPNTLDAPITAEQQARNAARPLFDSLLWVNDEGDIEPALAESWEISDDGLEYIFHLRQG